MKMSIDWHKEILENSKKHLDRKREELKRIEADIDRAAQRVNLHLAQIQLAEKEGKDGFDPERYAIKRLCV